MSITEEGSRPPVRTQKQLDRWSKSRQDHGQEGHVRCHLAGAQESQSPWSASTGTSGGDGQASSHTVTPQHLREASGRCWK